MNFDLAEDQILLRDSVARMLTSSYGFEARHAFAREPSGWSQAMWEKYTTMGLQGLLVPSEYGGYGGGGVELLQVMQEFGRALALEPFLHGSVLPAVAIAAAGSPAQKELLLPRIIDGSLRAAFAHGEAGGAWAAADIATTAYFDGAGWLLRGAKKMVMQGGGAELLVVSARTSGGPGDRDGIRLFCFSPNRLGVRCRHYPLQDGRGAADIVLDAVRVDEDELLHQAGNEGSVAVERTVLTGIAGIVAESVGSMEALFDMTVEYLRTRVQFGRPIGSNQALQHRAAEMLVALEQAKSMATLAAASLAETDPGLRCRHLSMAKAHVGELGRSLAHAAVQLHGGIAMTEEYAVGHHLKRLLVNDQIFGNSRRHLTFLAKTLPFNEIHDDRPLTQRLGMVLSA